jgi:ribosomal protein L16 Arg81 hydroxylase
MFNPDEVLSLEEFSDHLNFRPAITNERLKWIGWNERVEWVNTVWAQNKNTWPITLIDKFLDDYTLVLDDSSQINSAVNSVCKNIESVSNAQTDAHIFYSRKEGSNSFLPHWDDSHNFLLQIHGHSIFTAWSDEKGERFGNPKDVLFKKYLSPGDLVFFPRHSYHSIVSLGKRLSISFPFNPNYETINGLFRDWISI